MNPSPEAMAAAARLVSQKAVEAYGPNAGLAVADVIDTAFAPYHEQVGRLVEAGCQAAAELDHAASIVETIDDVVIEKLDAALAPFLEQESVKP